MIDVLQVVGKTYHVLPRGLDLEPLSWLLDEYQRLQQSRREDILRDISVVEIGCNRAIAAAFGSKVKPLVLPDAQDTEGPPAWWTKYREVNELD
ncbi:hypothetical protein D4Q85_00740 [bacterium]|nr:MAG: hypothetical protein D4Q85_00740 [bacterium]